MHRRRLLAASLAATAVTANPGLAIAAQTPLRLGVDRALAESGLAHALQHAFGADTGLAVKLAPGPALAILDAVKEGEVDAALTNVPAVETDLDAQGLVYDRQTIATGEFILVGPLPRTRGRPPPPGQSGVDALARIQEMATAEPGTMLFLSAGDGSGTHVVEQALWRAAHIDPAAPWYVAADAKLPFIAQVRTRNAFALVEAGAWAVGGGPPEAVLVEADPMLGETVSAMRSFRAAHPAGKIFVAWISGGRGRAVVSRHRGYRPAAKKSR
ncbi:MAG TPA: substrate-binding domain-containing protein [Caldimonas sp.]|nr:substrate-binding domain-containing protein [Caldimonas sp.]